MRIGENGLECALKLQKGYRLKVKCPENHFISNDKMMNSMMFGGTLLTIDAHLKHLNCIA